MYWFTLYPTPHYPTLHTLPHTLPQEAATKKKEEAQRKKKEKEAAAAEKKERNAAGVKRNKGLSKVNMKLNLARKKDI